MKFILYIFFSIFLFVKSSFSNDNLIEKANSLIDENKVQEAIELLLNQPDDIYVQYALGIAYLENFQDYENSLYWFEKCAELGNVDCQYNSYFINQEIFDNLERSQYWLEECANSGDPYCYNDMGHRYDNSIYVTENKKLAYEWFLKAAEENISNAFTSIASYYLDGDVVNQSYVKAFEFYEKGAASQNGNPERAIYALGLMHEKGLGTKVDYQKAKKLYLEANKLGHELSLLRKDALEGSAYHSLVLANKYKSGSDVNLGIPLDYEEAAFFYKIAEFKGSGNGIEFDELITIMNDGNYDLEWERAADRFEIWKANLGFSDQDTLNDITEFYLSHTGTASYINSNILVTNKHITHSDDDYKKKCDKIVGYNPYTGKYEEYESYETEFLPKSLDVDFIYNPNSTEFLDINLSTSKPRLGEFVIAIGFPQGDNLSKYPKITSGLVSSDFGSSNEPDEFMIDATSYGGSSGSPIFNIHNELIGILWGGPTISLSSNSEDYISDPNIAYVVKSSYLHELLNYNDISLTNYNAKKKYETYEIAEINVNRIRFIECYVK